MQQPLILVTNDDGIRASGLRALVEMAAMLGNVLVVAPDEGRSGQSHAITSSTPLRLRKIDSYIDAPNVTAYSCNGTPVDCTKLGMTHLLSEEPTLVLSGVNHGSNSSVSVIYSGTMAAAQEAAMCGVPAVGFSINSYAPDVDFTATKTLGVALLRTVMQHGLSPSICLNVNVPYLPLEQIRGVKICRQTNGSWRERYDRRVDPYGHEYFWLTGTFENNEPEANDTDEWALNNGYVAVVPIQPDMTAYHEMQRLKTIFNS